MERVDELKNILYVFIAQKYDSWNKQMCSLDVISIKCTTVKFWESLLDEKSKITKRNQSRNQKKNKKYKYECMANTDFRIVKIVV